MNTDELRELIARATPGPWHLCQHLKSMEADQGCSCGYRGVIFGPDKDVAYAICQPGHEPAPEGQEGTEPQRYPRETELVNSALIVAAINALPELLDRSDRLAAIDAVEVDAARELELDAKAFRENTVYNADGDPIRLIANAERMDQAADLIRAQAARIAELQQALVDADESPYCEACGSCGTPDCGCTHKCKYAFEHPDVAARIKALEEALVEEREENLWNAYNTGSVRNGRWSHMYMSDGESLARKCGFDPRDNDYDDAEIRFAIPRAARAALEQKP